MWYKEFSITIQICKVPILVCERFSEVVTL